MKFDTDSFYHRLSDGKLTRRELQRGMGALGISMVMLPAVSAGARAQDSCGAGAPNTFLWAGYEQPEFFSDFAEQEGCLPNFSFFGDEEEAFAKMRAGFQPDVMQPCTYKIGQWYDAGLLAPIDTAKLSHWNELIPSLRDMEIAVQGGNQVFVPVDWGQTSVTFRTDLAPEYVDPENHSWGILWDQKYAGRLAMIDSLIDGVAVAGIYVGIENPYDLSDPADMQAVREALAAQLPLLRFYSNDMTTVEQALASGELIAAATWNASANTLKGEGHPVEFMNPKEGAMTWVCGATRSTFNTEASQEMQDLAHLVIDSMIAPEAGVYEMSEWGYGHSNAKAFEIVGAETLAEMGLPENPDDLLSSGIFQEAMTPEDKIQVMFEEVKAGM